MIAAGIEIGTNKIEGLIFDRNWKVSARKRLATPTGYKNLIKTTVQVIRSCGDLPIGIAGSGLINPANGKAITSNVGAEGQTFPRDVITAARRSITWVNDSRAIILSEASFGMAEGHNRIAALRIGSSVSCAYLVGGRLVNGPSGACGEIGHMALPAPLVAKWRLPLVECSCGRTGCYETLLSGTGMVRLAQSFGENPPSAKEIADERGRIWGIWTEIAAEAIANLIFSFDPDVIVLGGGVSQAPNAIEDINAALKKSMITGFPLPEIVTASAGPASGPLGAAYAAWSNTLHD